ncbi:site-2 protease family protein [Crateriforma conspicua]|uniref:Putative peptide zinc metalloprotease protein YydH n=1 Tax=Crateriforma conspicua TaxID=2527996 RepID=A0A5C5Y7L7_9PLAN|nr:HlyD family efflux transporter periplasmic adaptor subunit [Crateriforma conspicua]QDV65774.1 Putative peptide zinc metalloprotease protein YydH [Crateriforma conspicua]TWT71174.1 putative peptide zinc metalloprotease protein YydH [Crateriforma conspicua]
MTTLAESLVSSSSRPLTVRKRPDLTGSRHHYQGAAYWVVKEPIGLQYFRFHDEEYFILNMLDGHVSLQQIKDGFEARFAPQKITFGDLQQFIGMLHRSGLVISNSPGQGKQLRERGRKKRNKELLGKFSNIFAIRTRGIDPEKILNRLLPWFGWMFTVPALLFFIGLFLTASLLLATQYETVYAKLPTFQQFFAADRWLILAATMGVVKVIHEFGHGLSCKKFGGECHEIGFMLLVFTPCLYCNVSDSWMLPNKWQRVWIGAAGIYVEMILASIAAFVWFFSEPGTTVNDLSLNIMFLNAVSTILVNGNPLLRFDGYYILMDLLEIPNLRQKATEVLKRWFQETCLGLELQEDPFLPQRNRLAFAMFTIASVIYRWVVVFSIVWFVMKVLEPYGLQAVGRLLAVAGFAGLVMQPIIQTWKFVRTPGRLAKVKKGRLFATLGIAGAILAAVAYIPLPHHIDCAFEIRPSEAGSVYAATTGRVRWTAQPGDIVSKGDPVAKLENPDLIIRLADLQGQEELARVQRANLTRRARTDESVKVQQDYQDEVLASIVALREKTEEEVKRLTVRAVRDGQVLPPADKPSQDAGDGRLPGWTGTPMQPHNIGALMTPDDKICEIGTPKDYEAVLIIDQGDMQLVRVGQEVDLKLDSKRLETFHGKLTEMSINPMQAASTNMSSQTGGDLQTEIDPRTGQIKPRSVSFQGRVPIDFDETVLRAGYRGSAKIHVDPMSLGQRLWRIIAKTFNFEF